MGRSITRTGVFPTVGCVLAILFVQFPSSPVRFVATAAAAAGPAANPGPPPPPPQSFYSPYGTYVSTYDHLDVSRLLKNDKLVSAYMKCFLNQAPCTAEGRQVKVYLLPEVIRTVCAKCSQRQKEMARQVLRHVYYTRRSEFDQLMKVYDTENKYNNIISFMNQS